MKRINEIIPFSDAGKQLEKRKETSITEDVLTMKELAEQIYEARATKYYKPLWFEINKGDNPDIWQDHLDTLGIEADSDCEVVTLKVVAYVEHQSPHNV